MDWQTVMTQSTNIRESIKALRAVIDTVEADYAAKEGILSQTVGKDQQVTLQSLGNIYRELENLVKLTQIPK